MPLLELACVPAGLQPVACIPHTGRQKRLPAQALSFDIMQATLLQDASDGAQRTLLCPKQLPTQSSMQPQACMHKWERAR